MRIRPDTEFFSVLRNAPTGLTGDLGVRLVNVETNEATDRQTDNIIELSEPSGIYRADLLSPSDQGTYVVQWDHDDLEFADDDLVEVFENLPPEPLAPVGAYASQDDLSNYIEGGLPDGFDSDYIDRVLQLASQDIDLYSNAYPYGGDTHLKFLSSLSPVVFEDALPSYTVDAIVEATCAQAEYRLAKGDQFFVEAQRPDITERRIREGEPRLAPKAQEALIRAGIQLRMTTAVLQ